jgi:hypothetical protein
MDKHELQQMPSIVFMFSTTISIKLIRSGWEIINTNSLGGKFYSSCKSIVACRSAARQRPQNKQLDNGP